MRLFLFLCFYETMYYIYKYLYIYSKYDSILYYITHTYMCLIILEKGRRING